MALSKYPLADSLVLAVIVIVDEHLVDDLDYDYLDCDYLDCDYLVRDRDRDCDHCLDRCRRLAHENLVTDAVRLAPHVLQL